MLNLNGFSSKTLLTDHQLVSSQPRIRGCLAAGLWLASRCLAADRTKTLQFWLAPDQAL